MFFLLARTLFIFITRFLKKMSQNDGEKMKTIIKGTSKKNDNFF